MTSKVANSLMLRPAMDDLETISETFMPGSEPARRRAIVAEAQRLRTRLSSTPWYADRGRRHGAAYWLQLAISYEGED